MATHTHFHQHEGEKIEASVDTLPQDRVSISLEIRREYSVMGSMTIYGNLNQWIAAINTIGGELRQMERDNADRDRLEHVKAEADDEPRETRYDSETGGEML